MRNTFYILCFLLLSSCSKENENPEIADTDFIVFGHFYGFCLGEECIEIYKLTRDALFEDTSDTYPRWDRFYEGQYVRLDESKFELVKSLAEDIPEQLFTVQNKVFGSPDAADGGGVYFAIKKGDQSMFWILDQMDQNIPEYLRSFKEKINESIALINN